MPTSFARPRFDRTIPIQTRAVLRLGQRRVQRGVAVQHCRVHHGDGLLLRCRMDGHDRPHLQMHRPVVDKCDRRLHTYVVEGSGVAVLGMRWVAGADSVLGVEDSVRVAKLRVRVVREPD